MAKGTQLAVWLDLQNHPLGTGGGENFTVPSNYRIPPARIYVRNHSRVRPWKRIVVPVSSRRGAEEALIYDKELSKIYNVDTLYRTVDQGRDMNRYEKAVHPVIFSFKVGGQTYAIPPARDDKSEPPKVEVREGAWDLFLGNYDRMRGIKRNEKGEIIAEGDQTIIGDEMTRKATYWRMRHNPVFTFTDDGVTTALTGDSQHHGEFGFLEFIRETQKQIVEPLDKEYLAALDFVES